MMLIDGYQWRMAKAMHTMEETTCKMQGTQGEKTEEAQEFHRHAAKKKKT